MNQTAFFEMLGAPLKNPRWSWGAVRSEGRVVFLKVWRDQMRTHGGSQFAQVTFHARFREAPRAISGTGRGWSTSPRSGPARLAT